MCKQYKVTNEEVQAAGSEIWVGKKGKRIAVKDMSDEYCRKALSCLLRKIRESHNGDSDVAILPEFPEQEIKTLGDENDDLGNNEQMNRMF